MDKTILLISSIIFAVSLGVFMITLPLADAQDTLADKTCAKYGYTHIGWDFSTLRCSDNGEVKFIEYPDTGLIGTMNLRMITMFSVLGIAIGGLLVGMSLLPSRKGS